MKKIRRYSLVVWVMLLCGLGASAQSSEATQLMLNVEKLSQLKNILADMKKGYTVISQGYKKVKDIASGNFSLHEVFLDGLMVVSPEVKKYRRVADIISAQKSIVSEYKAELHAFRGADVFNSDELDYLGNVYSSLFDASLQNLEDLTMVVTSSKLRMSDEERLKAIDRIFLDTSDKLEFLRNFNRGAVVLFKQKQKEKREIDQLKMYYGQ
ncbi:TerB family tellurite resistance protein [Pedobacter frigidisoli]|uniref:TerB family tellurite resistance protein n=1 Tax=Pedobacter frigidisoli TaxID=2530455 RepID=A0A4R0P078_9SPHI|nr:TerB family tellurite resistance protein [Pedobacter frigidisoli]TCD08590.1 TerB family tellurite resistance protein [Pedobacter frigidisoli]